MNNAVQWWIWWNFAQWFGLTTWYIVQAAGIDSKSGRISRWDAGIDGHQIVDAAKELRERDETKGF